MPIPWLALLQNLPWSDVIHNAPRVAEGAKRLWTTVARRPGRDADGDLDTGHDAWQARTPAALDKRLVDLEAQIAALEAQMVASADLIKALAEQNAALIERVERTRATLLWLAAATLATAAAALTAPA